MNFTCHKMIGIFKFEHFRSLMVFGTATSVGNFEKSNYLTNKGFLTSGPDKSPYGDVIFLAITNAFLSLRSFLVVLQRRVFFGNGVCKWRY
jgi:hypothetical protein